MLYTAHKLATQFTDIVIVGILKQYFSSTEKKLGKYFGSIVNKMGGKHALYNLEIA